jgi:hypothetical protein
MWMKSSDTEKELVYWDGMSIVPYTSLPAPGTAVYFVHEGAIIKGRVTALVYDEDGRVKHIVMNSVFVRKLREVALDKTGLLLRRIVMDHPPKLKGNWAL